MNRLADSSVNYEQDNNNLIDNAEIQVDACPNYIVRLEIQNKITTLYDRSKSEKIIDKKQHQLVNLFFQDLISVKNEKGQRKYQERAKFLVFRIPVWKYHKLIGSLHLS